MKEKRREWLKNKYPKGVGLGDIIREYMEYHEFIRQFPTHADANLRKSELSLLLNFIWEFKTTPTFSEEFGKFYL